MTGAMPAFARSDARRLVAVLLLTSLLALPGCGSEEPTEPVRSASTSTKKLEDLPPEVKAREEARRRAFAEEAFQRPAEEVASGEDAPSAWADYQACEKDLHSRIALAHSDELVQLVWVTRCMESKGWTLNPEADPSAWK